MRKRTGRTSTVSERPKANRRWGAGQLVSETSIRPRRVGVSLARMRRLRQQRPSGQTVSRSMAAVRLTDMAAAIP